VPEQLPSAGPTSKFCGIPATDASGKKIQFFFKKTGGKRGVVESDESSSISKLNYLQGNSFLFSLTSSG
jgi:hypothetical protein